MAALPPLTSSHVLIRALTRLLEGVLIVAMAALVLDVLWGVISRFVLASQSSWTEELARYLLVWVGLLGACLAFEKRAHLGIDYFVGKFHPAGQQLLRAGALFVVLFFAVVVLMAGGWTLVTGTLALGQETPALGFRKGWVYLAVPISGVFTALFTLGHLVDLFRRGNRPPAGEEDAP